MENTANNVAFLRFPPELRERIYELVFGGHIIHLAHPAPGDDDDNENEEDYGLDGERFTCHEYKMKCTICTATPSDLDLFRSNPAPATTKFEDNLYCRHWACSLQTQHFRLRITSRT